MSRSHVHEIEIDAPVEQVWKAISEGPELTRWYVQAGEVDGRPGGRYSVSWGPGQHSEMSIEIWEPGRHLRLVRPAETPDTDHWKTIVEDYHLEARGGRTILRLVHSGFPDDEAWDASFHSTRSGWEGYLAALRFYVERHFGKPRETVEHMRRGTDDPKADWERMIGPEGIDTTGALVGRKAGDRFAITTSVGDTLEGWIDSIPLEGGYVSLVLGADAEVRLMLSVWQIGPATLPRVALDLFGAATAQRDALSARWGAWLDALFPPS